MLICIMQYGHDVYVMLVWLFSGLFSVFMLLLCSLIISMRNLQKSESKSRAFSYLVIEGIETERRRISRELHDMVLPQVHGLPVSNQIRTVCLDLMPPDFTRVSLKNTLAAFSDNFGEKTGIDSVCSIEKEVNFSKISAENQLHIFRIVQEAFTNIEKHSKSEKASLVVRRSKGTANNILICISDDGIGLGTIRNEQLGVSNERQEGLGMKSMLQRTDIIGGKLDFINVSENGLMVRLEI